ncbi:MAG: MDR family MFS transporter [Candidatus Thorarchaeota archaeon]
MSDESKMPGPYKIVLATSFGIFLGALDSSIVNVSLVTMANSLGVTMTEIQWIVISYLLIITSLMPLMGKFGDRFGKTKIFQVGMLLFIIGSFLCAQSMDLVALIVFRVFQAIGASMMTANGLALVTYFTTPQNRGRAIGLNSIILAVALGLGPALGGILSQYFGWPSIFLVNLPIGVIGFIIAAKIIPETEKVEETKFDTIGGALFFTFLFSMVYFVSITDSLDVFSSIIYLAIIFGSITLFILRERSFSSPLIPTKILADKEISTSIFSAFFAFMAIVPISFLIPFYLQEALGFDQSTTGLFLMAHPIVILVLGPAAGIISERVRARTQTVFGLIIQLLGLLFLSYVIPNIFLMIIGIIIMGTGLSLFTVANGNFIMTSAPREYMGVVSALTNIARTTGFATAIALVTSVFTFFFAINNPNGSIVGQEYVSAYSLSVQLAILAFCSFVVVAIIISALRGVSAAEKAREALGNQEVDIPSTPERIEV